MLMNNAARRSVNKRSEIAHADHRRRNPTTRESAHDSPQYSTSVVHQPDRSVSIADSVRIELQECASPSPRT